MINEVKPIMNIEAISLVNKYHYSKVMPKINKCYIGGYEDNELVAVCTLGYGVRPLHTIQKCFPSMGVKDYFEIGKLCLVEDMPKNSESRFISLCIKYIKKRFPNKKVLFTWADGIIGKPGYVYQCSNFLYGGYIWSEIYLDADGIRVHPRSIQSISKKDSKTKGRFGSRSYSKTKSMGYKKYFGKQFRYIYPLSISKKDFKELLEESPFDWNRKYPKDKDLKWKVQVDKGKRKNCEAPPFVRTLDKVKPKKTFGFKFS